LRQSGKWSNAERSDEAEETQRQVRSSFIAANRRRYAWQYVRRVEVKGIRWLGVATESVSLMRSFAIEVLGLRVVGEDTEQFVELAMSDGAKLEFFGSAAVGDSPWLFESNPIVAGFLVDDIEAARDELASTPNVELLGELRVLPGGYAWQHFRAPDGHVYELTADPAAR
jgi:hypothetical protein